MIDGLEYEDFSFEQYLVYVMRDEPGYEYLVKDHYTRSLGWTWNEVEESLRKFGEVKTVDYNLERMEEELAKNNF